MGGIFMSIQSEAAKKHIEKLMMEAYPNSPEGLRNWREKNNAAMAQGWRVFHYAPEEVIKAGRKGQGESGAPDVGMMIAYAHPLSCTA